MDIQGTKYLKKLSHCPYFKTLLVIAVNVKTHSSSEKTEDFCFVLFFQVGLNASEIQSRKHVSMFQVHLNIIVREVYVILSQIRDVNVCEWV